MAYHSLLFYSEWTRCYISSINVPSVAISAIVLHDLALINVEGDVVDESRTLFLSNSSKYLYGPTVVSFFSHARSAIELKGAIFVQNTNTYIYCMYSLDTTFLYQYSPTRPLL